MNSESILIAMIDAGNSNENQNIDNLTLGNLTNGKQNEAPYRRTISTANKSDTVDEEKKESRRFSIVLQLKKLP